jgi:hypothetical protein
MNEPRAARQWLDARLRALPALTAIVGDRIFASRAKKGTLFPLVIYNVQAGGNTSAAGGRGRILSEPLILVKAVTNEESYAQAGNIADIIDGTLTADDADGQVTFNGVTYRVTVALQESPLEMDEHDGDATYRHCGGVYRFVVYKL